ncbi:MAG: CPBP family intramembrane metalloprotease [bacterium]|nr:CPBP family intramembrane metalloprotease [bacterium]
MKIGSARAGILGYLALLLPVTYALQLLVLWRGGLDGPLVARFAPLIMFLPGVTALAMLLRTGEGLRSIPWRIGRPRYLIAAAFIPALSAMLCVAIISSLKLGSSPHLQLVDGLVVLEKGRWVLGQGGQSVPRFALNLAATAVVFAVVNGVFAAGEEIGWRGYLQPRLVERLGPLGGIVILGLIWAHWHTPMILAGYNYAETPVLGALVLFPLELILASFLLAWLTIQSRSVWPAALAHGSTNAFHGHIVQGMELSGPRLGADLVTLSVALAVAVPAYLTIRRRRH